MCSKSNCCPARPHRLRLRHRPLLACSHPPPEPQIAAVQDHTHPQTVANVPPVRRGSRARAASTRTSSPFANSPSRASPPPPPLPRSVKTTRQRRTSNSRSRNSRSSAGKSRLESAPNPPPKVHSVKSRSRPDTSSAVRQIQNKTRRRTVVAVVTTERGNQSRQTRKRRNDRPRPGRANEVVPVQRRAPPPLRQRYQHRARRRNAGSLQQSRTLRRVRGNERGPPRREQVMLPRRRAN